MAVATIFSRAQLGIDAPLVRVEVDIGNGLPAFSIVGLPEVVVKESKDRVRAAIANSRYEFPTGRIVVNLAPAELPKEGGRFDLPIAIGILVAAGQLRPAAELPTSELYGELSLNGELRVVKGVLPAAVAAAKAGNLLIVPSGNVREASFVSACKVASAHHLLDVCGHYAGVRSLPVAPTEPEWTAKIGIADLADVRGQHQARRALEIAAAGSHSLLFVGPPGTGKSMLAQRLPGLLPPLDESEALEVAAIRSAAGQEFALASWRERPFRHPHHTASAVSLVGGGTYPRPGEVTLAHRGVLFLDELPEFSRRVLEVLREPIETGRILVSRAARQVEYPARFQLVAAMNPCPCGHRGDAEGQCRCTAHQVERYRLRISGPLLDRIDLQLEVPRVRMTSLFARQPEENSATVAARVATARTLQLARQGVCNGELDVSAVERLCQLGAAELTLLERAMHRLQLSARAYHRILKVARTIADLAQCPVIQAAHLNEAIGLRRLDRQVR